MASRLADAFNDAMVRSLSAGAPNGEMTKQLIEEALRVALADPSVTKADRVIGYQSAVDSEAPPPAEFPWHLVCALAIAFTLGTFGLHWSYVLPIFWVLHHMDERRRRRTWAVMKRDQIIAEAASRDVARKGETVIWLNHQVRAVWPLYEPAIAEYVKNKILPYLEYYTPRSLGVVAMKMKHFSFGTVTQPGSRRAPTPLLIDSMKMVEKRVDASGPRDKHSVTFVLQADVRWLTGDTPSVILDIEVGHRLISVPIDVEVQRITAAGTLRIELVWIRPYPYLGSVSLAFVKAPEVRLLHNGYVTATRLLHGSVSLTFVKAPEVTVKHFQSLVIPFVMTRC